MKSLIKKFQEKFNYRKRYDILKLIPPDSTGAEIGVFKGDFSKLILKHAKPQKVHFIDGWWTLYGEYFPDWGRYTNYGKLKTRDAYESFIRKIQPYRKQSDIKIHVGNNLEILKSLPDNYFDWVYIDSSHEFDHTYQELIILKDKIKENGIIMGHDFITDESNIHYGVKKAIDTFIIEYKYHIYYLDTFTQWAIKKTV